jgi:hypothetical protein
VQVVNLATLVKAPSNPNAAPGSSDGFITSILVLTTPTGTQPTLVTPDAAQLRGIDSLGQSHGVAYMTITMAPGLTIGATTIRGVTGPAKTVSLELGGAQTGASPSRNVSGPWKVDLVRQLVNSPTPGSLVGAFGYKTLPLQAATASVSYRYLGGGFLTIALDRPSQAAQTLYVVVDLSNGLPRAVAKDEFDRLQPQPPRPSVIGTPRPEAPLR